MSTFFASLLTAHVLLGLIAVMCSFAVSLMLLKSEPRRRPLLSASAFAFIGYFTSWLTGGWYYWKYYGTNVKPVILSGGFDWAHLVIMEAKEHAFLFLPFATLVLALIIYFGFDKLSTDASLKGKVALLSVVTTALAIIITLSGVLITGGAR